MVFVIIFLRSIFKKYLGFSDNMVNFASKNFKDHLVRFVSLVIWYELFIENKSKEAVQAGLHKMVNPKAA
jgi:hypothetical protein